MASITKDNGQDRYLTDISTINGNTSYNWVNNRTTNSIVYEAGPKISRGRCNWKECRHVWRTAPTMATISGHYDWGTDVRTLTSTFNMRMLTGAPAPASALPPIQDCWSQIWDQVDLNTGDSVLLYSGILQSIPLIGGALKGVSLLNRAARKLSKSFKKKPFTTVVKSLIQGDFINRFVVQPTMDDMRKFADSFDYVIRTIQTAQDRNAELATAFRSSLTNITYSDRRTTEFSYGFARVRGEVLEEASATRQLFMLAKVSYDQNAINPFKLWAKRVGLSKPLDSAWDMVPFSFVLDYFARAGEFLSMAGDQLANQDALIGQISAVFDCWCTTKCERRIVMTPSFTPQRHWLNFTADNAPIKTSAGEFRRNRVELMSAPGFWDNGIVDVRLSTTRYRTLAELFIQKKLR